MVKVNIRSRRENVMERELTLQSVGNAEKLMALLTSLPEEKRESVAMAAYFYAQGIVAKGMQEQAPPGAEMSVG